MAKYSKLIGTILGSVVGVLFSYLASRGLATCTVVDAVQTCAMWGISQAQVTGFLLAVFASAGTWIAPPNSPLSK